MFRRLGAFVGGCSLEAAEVVCSSSEEPDGEILETLESLIDKNRLRGEEDTEVVPRFSMLAKDRAGNALDQDPSVTGNQQKVWSFTIRS